MMRNPSQTIGNLIEKATMTTLAYIDAEGYPVSRAMFAPRARDGIHTFWFTTNTSSQKISCYRDDPKGSIYFVDKRFFRGVCLKGTMEVSETKEAKEMIWQEGDTMYYPLGAEDPDYCVLKFTAEKGRYYSKFNSEDFDIE